MGKICKPKFYSGPVNEGENNLIRYLEAKLPDNYYIVPNGNYPCQNAQGAIVYYEYDAIVIAPHAIYHIENKDFSGTVEGDDQTWYHNGHPMKHPLISARYKSKLLVSYLKQKNAAWSAAWIETILVLSKTGQTKEHLDDCNANKMVFLLNSNELCDYICDNSILRKSANAISSLQLHITDYLTGSCADKTHRVTSVIGLKVVEVRDHTEDYEEYLCCSPFFEQKQYIVRDYALNRAGLSPMQLEKHNAMVKNAQITQEQLPFSPNIIRSEYTESEDGNHFYEKHERMEEHSLRAEMVRNTFTEPDKVRILTDIANALQIAHDHGILHRNVTPENIFLTSGNAAALGNFGLSYNPQHEKLDVTVTTTSFDYNPYIPAEVFDGDASAASDVYSFGVITYELMTGQKVPFTNHIDFAKRFAGILPEEKLPSSINSNVPKWVDEVCRRTIIEDVSSRWNNIQDVRSYIINHFIATQNDANKDDQQSHPSNVSELKLQDLKPGDQVTSELTLGENLGKGGFSRVFRVSHVLQPDNKLAIKIFEEGNTAQAVIDEYQALSKLNHNNIVRFYYNGLIQNRLFYTLMEYVDGENLGKYSYGNMRLPLPVIYNMAESVLDALKYMQEQETPMYHRDIKPYNIMMDKNQRFVLIDFNIASDNSDSLSGAGTRPYMAPDMFTPHGIVVNKSTDTFALGITIYELLAHGYPWTNSKHEPKLDVKGGDIKAVNNQISDDFAAFVMKSIETREADRFGSAKEMLDALRAIGSSGITKKQDVVYINPEGDEYDIVDYINSLYSQSRHGNAGTRASLKESILDKETYTKTKLDTVLLEDIKAGKYKLVIITGNAGDGKTAFLHRIEAAASNVEQSANGATFTIGGMTFRSNYDGSQDEANLKNDDVLTEFFRPFENIENFKQAQEGRIIAINEGRLMDFLLNHAEHKQLADLIDKYFYEEGMTEMPEGILVINLNLRSITASDRGEKSLLRQQIELLTNKRLWSKCERCPIANQCYIKYNVDTLSDSASGAEVQNRLEWLLRAVVYKREVHITMRDLRSVISWLLTRDNSCSDVQYLLTRVNNTKGDYEANPSDKTRLAYYKEQQFYWQHYYFNLTAPSTIYADLNSDDRVVKMLRETDIANVAIPNLDRDLYYKDKNPNEYLLFAERDRNLLTEFNESNSLLASYNQSKEEMEILKARHPSFIRHQYFEGSMNFDYAKRIPYQSISEFHDMLADIEEERKKIIKSLSLAISCSEGCWNEQLYSKFLLLSSSPIKDPYGKAYRLFPLSDFTLEVAHNDHLVKYIEHEHDSFIFRHKTKKFISLNVSLDLYEMLYFIQKGFNPSLDDLNGRFVELQVFKNLLESETYKDVLVTQNDRDYFRISLQADNKINVERVNTESLC